MFYFLITFNNYYKRGWDFIRVRVAEQNRTEQNFIFVKLDGTIQEELNTNQSKI